MFVLINGSQKNHYSNSNYFLDYISKYISNNQKYYLKTDSYDVIINSIKKAKAVVFAFPLYVDSPNYVTLAFLDYIIDKKISLKNKNIYCIINCGFREGEQNLTALNIMKSFSRRVKCKYSGAILIGAGEVVGKSKFRFVSHKALKSLRDFASGVNMLQETGDIITTMDLLNNKLYCFIANCSWNRQALKNHLTKEDVITK